MNAAAILLATALMLPANVLVLRSGERIDVTTAKEENGRVVFRTPSGGLFSVPADEVDRDATANAAATESQKPEPQAKRLKATEAERKQLLQNLEQNHSGQAAPFNVEALPKAPSAEERAAEADSEWSWRNRARTLEEGVRQAKENRDLLVAKAEALRAHIASLISLGYRPIQFSYDTTELQYTLDQIPYAELDIKRAERALAEFRDEARKRGVQPGWLR